MGIQQSNDKKYYWLGGYPLENGSIVLPGNWGRIVNSYQNTSEGSVMIYLREKILEDVRVRDFPSLPSRTTSIFLCESIGNAKLFRDANGRFLDILYEVELLDKEKPLFRTDWSYLNWPSTPFFLKQFEEMAYLYWKAENIQNPEILTESRIKIIRKIE